METPTKMDTGNELDEILSGGDITPAATTVETTAIPDAAPAAEAGQPRGPDGKFAPKAGDLSTPEVPGNTHSPTGDGPHGTVETQPGAMVPQQALHAARQENAELRRSMDEMRGQINLLSQRTMQPPPAPKEPVIAKEIWDGPDAFVDDRVNTALTPVQEQMRTLVLTYSRREAVREHGQEKIDAAEAALKQAITSGTLNSKEVTDRLQASLDPVGDVVNWHTRQAAQLRVGNDPDKWLESELERRLSDPAEQAKILERIRAGAAANPGSGPTPATKLPPSLSRLPGGANQAPSSDLSDAGLFAHATAR